MGNINDKSPVMTISKDNLDVIAQTSAATAMALSTSYCLERKGLCDLSEKSSFLEIIKRTNGKSDLASMNWVKIEQVGKPDNSDFKSCYSALQNILHSCALPRHQLVFLIVGEDGIFNIYMGLHGHAGAQGKNAIAISEINSFVNVCWPGVKTSIVSQSDKTIKDFTNHRYEKAYAITGIPSLELEKNSYPSSVEHLIGGTHPKGNLAYIVVADPVDEKEIDSIIYACDEMRGQTESFKSFTFSESLQKGKSQSMAQTLTDTIGKTVTDGTSDKDFTPVKKALKWGLGLAALAIPPLGVANTIAGVGALLSSVTLASGSSAMIGLGFLSGLLPQKSHSESNNEQHSKAETITDSVSENYTKTMGATIVNGHMDSIAEQLKNQKNRFLTGKAKGMWRTGCYLFTDRYNLSSHLQLKSILSGDSSQLEPIRVHDISSFVEDQKVEDGYKVIPFITPPDLNLVTRENKEIFAHPFGQGFSSLTTYLTTEELTSMVNFPLHSVPGVSVVECPPEFRLDVPRTEKKNPITLGRLLHRGKETDIIANLNLDTLVRHSLVCGSNGSGKTNTVLGILNEVQRHDKNFMVIEPAKTEYVDWAIKFNEQLEQDQKEGNRLKEIPITIYMPGRKHYWHTNKNDENEKYLLKDILKINPFEPVVLDDEEPNVQSHLDRIKSIFSLAFPMEDILPTVMETLLTDVYTYGEPWLNRKDDEAIPKLFPTLSLLRCRATNVIKGLGYEQRVTANISAAINLRLSNLLSGWKRELFNNEVLGGYKKLSKSEIEQGIKRPTWDEFFNRRVVINLSGIADDNDRVFVMGLLLLYLYEYRVATSERPGFSFNDETLKHLMVIEEAHRVMTKSSDPNSPQYKCGALFSQILSEIRAYGQGIMVVDQIPSRLIEDATKNTNMKIVHRLIAADDIDSVSSSMGVNDEQKRIFPKLTVGQAVIAGLNASMSESVGGEDIYWVKIKKNK